MKKLLAFILPIVVLLVGVTGFAFLRASKPKATPVAVAEKIWNVATQQAQPQRLAPSLTLYARVYSNRVSTLSAAINADVLAVPALEGARVKQGDLLVELDGREAQLLLTQRQAALDEIRSDLDNELQRYENNRRQLVHEQQLLELTGRDVARAEQLATRDMGSAARLDEARQAQARQAMAVANRRLAIDEHKSLKAALLARQQLANAQRQRAQLDLQRTRVKAPFDGRISDILVSVGNRVQPATPLLKLIDTANLELRAQIPGRHLATVRNELHRGNYIQALARVDGALIRATLKRLSAEVKRGSGGADALFELTKSDAEKLELGRTIELELSLAPVGDVIPIPATALYGTDVIYVLREQRMHRMKVQRIGAYRDPEGQQKVLVKNLHISATDQIVITQLPNAMEGLKVHVQP